MASFDRSQELWSRAERVIPLGTQTLSKGPSQFVQGVTPIYLERGRGSHVWDVDGNEYVDWPMALGPVLLGHADPEVDEAIVRQLRDGITFTLMHPLEVEVAERIVAMCPGVEAVRFGKTGSDANSAAIRAARAITGRDVVVAIGYHGWHDWYIGSTTRAIGVPESQRALTVAAPFNDLESLAAVLDAHAGQVAAVICEPVAADVPDAGYLEGLVELARRHGALSIFDEIIVGFRIAPGGARERYGVEPDLSTYGKALGNGMPISAVGGRWEIMRVFEQVFFSGTHGGEALSLAAARVVLDVVADGAGLAHIERVGQRLLNGIRASLDRHGLHDQVVVGGLPSRIVVQPAGGDLVRKSWMQQCLVERGAIFNGNLIPCMRHDDDDVDRTLAGFEDAFEVLADPSADVAGLLKGPPVQPVFRAP